MAATATSINLTPIERALGLRMNNLDMEFQPVTKSSGDTTASFVPIYLTYVQEAYLFTGNVATPTPLTLDTGAAALITNTPGSQSVAFSTVTTGSGTLNGICVMLGTANPIHPA